MTQHLTFGAEFEVVIPTDHHAAAREISRLTGFEVVVDRRTSTTSRSAQAWRIVHDGSVETRGRGYGAEFVSPILSGPEDLEKVAKFARALVAFGATVNDSCGFHVHVGGFRRGMDFFKNITKLYARYETAIDGVMAVSRRGGRSTYARSMARVLSDRYARAVDAAGNLDQLIEASTGMSRYDYARRFFKLNLAAFEKHNTVEFRQHQGTVDAAKATTWIKTCLRMVAAAEQGKTGIGQHVPVTVDASQFPAKTRAVVEMITRPQGATRLEVLEGRGWGTISVERHARIAGLSVRTVREAGRERFFAVSTTTEDVPADLAGLMTVIAAPADEAAFFQGRAQQLAA